MIHEKQQGIVHALNRGLMHATGKYIARMDADDWSFPERLNLQRLFLESNLSCDVVAGKAIYVSHNDKTQGFTRYVNWSNSIDSSKLIRLRQFIESPIIHPTVMWRKRISDKYGAYKYGNFPEDYELWLRWLHKGVEFQKLKEPIIKWFDNEKRLTREDDRYSDLAFSKIRSKYLAKWLMKYNPHHPKVFIWGASKISRKRANLLLDHGIEISAFIDISSKRQIDQQIIDYQKIPSNDKIFVLVFLKEEKMRAKTQQYLEKSGFTEGESYLLTS